MFTAVAAAVMAGRRELTKHRAVRLFEMAAFRHKLLYAENHCRIRLDRAIINKTPNVNGVLLCIETPDINIDDVDGD